MQPLQEISRLPFTGGGAPEVELLEVGTEPEPDVVEDVVEAGGLAEAELCEAEAAATAAMADRA